MMPVRRVMRWAAFGLAGLVVLGIVGVAVAVGVLRTDMGRGWLVAAIEDAVAAPDGTRLAIGGLGDGLPWRIELTDVTMADADGVWLAVDRASVRWEPFALLARRLSVDDLSVTGVTVRRLPAGGEDEAEVASGPPGLPELPVDVVVERFEASGVRIDEAVAGVAADLALTGRAALRRDGPMAATAVLERLDGAGGRIEFDADYDPDSDRLVLKASGSEPEGGLIATRLGLPGRPPVAMAFDGTGPASDWRGRLAVDVGTERVLDTALLVDAPGGRLRLDGEAWPEPFVGAEMAPLVAGGLTFAADLAREGERVGVSGLELRGQALSLQGAAAADFAGGALSGRFKATLAEPAAIASLAGLAGLDDLGDMAVDLVLGGTVAAPEVAFEARVARVALAEMTFTDLTVAARAAPTATPIPFRVEARYGSAETSMPELAVALAGSGTLAAGGHFDAGAMRLALVSATATTDRLSLELAGSLGIETLAADLRGTLAARDPTLLALLAGLPLRAGARVGFEVKGDGAAGWNVAVDGGLSDLRADDPLLAAALGPQPSFAARLAVAPSGAVTGRDLRVDIAAARLTADLDLPADAGRIDLRWRVAVPDLGRLSQAAGTPLAGRLGLSGTLAGPWDALAARGTLEGAGLAVAGTDLGAPSGRFTLSNLADGVAGPIELRVQPLGRPVSLSTRLRVTPTEVRLDELALVAEDGRLDGGLGLETGTGLARGRLRAGAGGLAPWLALAGVGGRGDLKGLDLVLDADRGVQTVALKGTVANVVIETAAADGAAEETVRVGSLSVDARVRLAEDPTLSFDLRAGRAVAADLSLREAAVTGKGNFSALDLTGRLRGRYVDPLTLNFAARVALDDAGISVALSRLEGTAFGEALKLQRTARFTMAGANFRLSDLALAVGGGRIVASGALDTGRVSAEIDVRDVPVRPLRAFLPVAPIAGTIRATAALSGPVAAPEGTVSLAVEGIRAADAPDLPPLAATLDARFTGGRVDAEGSVSGVGDEPLRLTASLPVALGTDLPAARDDSISGRVAWNGDIRPIWRVLPVDGQRLGGTVGIDLAVSGTMAAPRLDGGISLDDGFYENLDAGTLLRDITLRARAAGDALLIESLEATDGGSGRVSGTGRFGFDPAGDFPFRVETRIVRALVARRDDVTARASGNAAIDGNVSGATLKVRMVTDQVDVTLVGGKPAGVVALPVVEIGGGRVPPKPEDENGNGATAPFTVTLDVAVNMPRRVFVRGMGLDSEWSGDIRVEGTAADPIVSGQVASVRGQISFAGKVFTLQESRVYLEPGSDGSIGGRLDITAVNSGGGLTVTVHVTGPFDAPEIALSSTPTLPRDEILARLLFGKNASQLTGLEALQLAAAVAELSGALPSSGGFLGDIRGALGLDVLRFESGEGGDAASTRLKAGTYIGDRIFVGAGRGAAAGSGAVSVEIEVLPPYVSVESDVNEVGDSDIGIKFKWDY